jgi:ATP-binding cassette subfamily B protein
MLLINAGAKLVRELRCRGYEQICRLSMSYHEQNKVGDSLYRIAYDTQAGMTLISGALAPLLQSGVMLGGIIFIMVRIDWILTLVAAGIAPVIWQCIRYFGRRVEKMSRTFHESESSLLSTVQESLTSMRAVQAFTREPDTSVRFGGLARASSTNQLRLVANQLLFSTAVALTIAAGSAAAMGLGAQRALGGHLSAGDVLLFLAYIGMLYQPFQTLSQSASVIQSTRAQLGRVFEVLDATPAVTDRPGARALSSVTGAIEFRDLSFGYDGSRPVLTHISFKVNPGEVVAIVGPTGAGKTTLASLLLRFYDPQSGCLLLDGHDLRDLPLAWLRSNVSVVLQEALLLSGTIRENIAYGRPDAGIEEIEAAARAAQAHEFIEALPEGYETNLAERAANLSGGQKQRLAIARAFLKDAPILVLDEPTSALDMQTESVLLAALRRLAAGRTTLVIAHRFATVRLAQRIIVMRNGMIVEQGTHEMLAVPGTYYQQIFQEFTRTAETSQTALLAAPESQ